MPRIQEVATILVIVLGMLLVGGALITLVRGFRHGKSGSLRVALSLLVVGVFLAGLGGFRIWQQAPLFTQLLQHDFDDPAKLEKLKTTSLTSPEETPSSA